MRTFHASMGLAITIGLFGCAALQPVSTLSVGNHFHAEPAAAEGVSANWWLRYDEPQVDVLIGKAISNNDDIKLALPRVMEARTGADAVFIRLLHSLAVNASQTDPRTTLPDPLRDRSYGATAKYIIL